MQQPSAALAIEYPEHFRGIYEQVRARHSSLLHDAVVAIREQPISEDLRSSLAYQTWDNPQPSFILLPMMFLATADASGGVTRRHIEYLPALMLLAELLAVADDTVDRCMRRSGRDTYAHRYGDASALPFSTTLVTMFLQASHRAGGGVFEAASTYFAKFFPLELWEREHTFPDPSLFASWLDHRHNQSVWSTQLVLDAALLLNGQPTWPSAAVAAIGRIGQDVDDIVNLVEYRESDGENDDLMCGVVSRPLVRAVELRPSLGADIAALWDRHRPLSREQLSIGAYHERRQPLVRETLAAYAAIRAQILEVGVPATVRDAYADLRVSIRESPPALQDVARGLSIAFLDRLRASKVATIGAEATVE